MMPTKTTWVVLGQLAKNPHWNINGLWYWPNGGYRMFSFNQDETPDWTLMFLAHN